MSECAISQSVERFGSALNLNLHFHSILPDGVFVPDDHGTLRFLALLPPEDHEVHDLLVRAARRVLRLWEARQEKADGDTDPYWSQVVADAIQPPLPALATEAERPALAKRRCASIGGFSLHADVAVDARDRAGLERLLRYGGRPPFAHTRLALTPEGKVSYRLRRPWYTGQTHVVLEPTAFLRRLALLVPPPRQNLIRFHGLLAPNAKLRPALLALVPSPADGASAVPPAEVPQAATPAGDEAPARTVRRRPWAELFRRVFAEDLLCCPRCHGRMRVIALITDPAPIGKILTHLGLPTAPPRVAPARAPPEPLFLDESAFA